MGYKVVENKRGCLISIYHEDMDVGIHDYWTKPKFSTGYDYDVALELAQTECDRLNGEVEKEDENAQIAKLEKALKELSQKVSSNHTQVLRYIVQLNDGMRDILDKQPQPKPPDEGEWEARHDVPGRYDAGVYFIGRVGTVKSFRVSDRYTATAIVDYLNAGLRAAKLLGKIRDIMGWDIRGISWIKEHDKIKRDMGL